MVTSTTLINEKWTILVRVSIGMLTTILAVLI